MFVIIACDPDERGADSVQHVFGVFDTEQDTLDVLADMRDDNGDVGNGWTYMEVQNV